MKERMLLLGMIGFGIGGLYIATDISLIGYFLCGILLLLLWDSEDDNQDSDKE